MDINDLREFIRFHKDPRSARGIKVRPDSTAWRQLQLLVEPVGPVLYEPATRLGGVPVYLDAAIPDNMIAVYHSDGTVIMFVFPKETTLEEAMHADDLRTGYGDASPGHEQGAQTVPGGQPLPGEGDQRHLAEQP